MKYGRRRSLVLLAAAFLIAGGAAATWLFTRPDPDTLRVPLGVEQAAIVTYSGPKLSVAPYKWGVAVNVRIAEVIEQPGRRIYDLRYIVNRSGTFDLRDFLAAEDGGKLTGLPTFEFTGDPKLSKDLDTRIQETEGIQVDVGGRYYESLVGLGIFWIGWLILLIFWKRPKPPAEPDPGPPKPTLAEQLRGYLAQLEGGTLDTAAKAKLEMTLLQCWRDELDVVDDQMTAALRAIRLDSRTGDSLETLQLWIHHPKSPVATAEIVDLIRPYAAEPAAS